MGHDVSPTTTYHGAISFGNGNCHKAIKEIVMQLKLKPSIIPSVEGFIKSGLAEAPGKVFNKNAGHLSKLPWRDAHSF